MFVGVAKVLISPHFVEDSLFLFFFLSFMFEWSIFLFTKTNLFKYIENFTAKNENFRQKFWYFSYFCSELTIYVFEQK